MNQKKEFQANYGGKTITFETGRMAKQADGSILVSCEGTQVLVTVCSAKTINDGQDFFPLMVDYKEKFYAAGKFLGGFMKREGRPSNSEILLMRMIDRPLRPLFPEGYMCETIVMAQVMSYDEAADPQILAGLGTAAALAISDIPFDANLGFCNVGLVDGQFILNPTLAELEKSALELVVAATDDAILMVEGEAQELSEAKMLEALNFAHTEIKKVCQVIAQMKKEVGKTKREWSSTVANQILMDNVEKEFGAKIRSAISIDDKLERQNANSAVMDEVAVALKADPEKFGLTADDSFKKEAYKAVDGVLYLYMRNDILNESKRIGGRSLEQVRPIETEINILHKVHGSSLFTRGETQVLAAVTIGGKEGEQMKDSIAGISFDRFYLHYTFPPFSVGEARGYRGVGRREIGHGNLAERALKKVLPAREDFPYVIRIACEVLESNGSSSMGSVCSGSMALMDAGVPLKAPVAGVAMGLVAKDGNFKILTDILGDEDHLGDMDFKVAGTVNGITAIQMDIKIAGITNEIFTQAMEQARVGRLHILQEMAKTISTARPKFKAGVPQIKQFKIAQDKIGEFIGPGGKNIKAFQEEFKVNCEVEEDGTINIMGTDNDILDESIVRLDLKINGPKRDAVYQAKVITIKEYGAFVDIVPGVSGLIHVSEISDERVKDVKDYIDEGDVIAVKVIDVDNFGRIKLSAKAVKPLEKRA